MSKKILFALVGVVLAKCLLFFTHHIQEDAFITWRVARNILEFGVYGFNGMEKISASTTHLNVFVSVIYQAIFGEDFIYPILITNTILLTIGIYWLSQFFFKDQNKQILFIIFVSFLPPAIKMSILGMEFSIIFFLYISLMKYGFIQRKNWAFILFPILLLWARIDTAIFLGLLFLVDIIYHKKWNMSFMFGGLIALVTVLAFNQLYFGEWVNNTITSKKNNYYSASLVERINQLKFFGQNYFGMIKLPINMFNFVTVIVFFLSVFSSIIVRKRYNKKTQQIIIFFMLFGVIKSLLFGFANSWFDWYYWIPQIVIFIPVILVFLDYEIIKKQWIIYVFLFGIPYLLYQTIHSIATGHTEWYYYRDIGLYLDKIEPNKNKTIFLEPAGYIPYFSKLKTIDQVGLVDKRLTEEKITEVGIAKGFSNLIIKAKPDYILDDYNPILEGQLDSIVYDDYVLLKEFHIKDVTQSSNKVLDFIYKLKPSGKNAYIYKRK